MKTNKGFTPILIAIAVVAVLAIGGVGYFAGKSSAPTSQYVPEDINQQQNNLVGNDRDEHGCIGSAGYTWCEVKNKCLRVWEEKCEIASSVKTISQAEAEALVSKTWGACHPDGCSDVTVTTSQDNIVTATYGLLDDSTALKRYEARAVYQGGSWILGQSTVTYFCHRGHVDGSQGFSSSLCI